MTSAPLYHQLCPLNVNCGILHSSDLITALKELPLVKIQYNKPMRKERPAEDRVKCVPPVGLSSVLSSFRMLSTSAHPEALLLLATPALSVATSAILFDAQMCNLTLIAFTYTSDGV